MSSTTRGVVMILLLSTACSSDDAISTAGTPPEACRPRLVPLVVPPAGTPLTPVAIPGEFGEVKAVLTRNWNEFYVIDGMNRHVLSVDREGNVLATLGRHGRGPGEFQYPIAAAFLEDGSLAVFDEELWRITHYVADSLARAHAVPAMPAFGQSASIALAQDGEVYGLTHANYQRSAEQSLGGRSKGIGRGIVGVAVLDTVERRWTDIFEAPGQEVYIDLDEGALQDVWFADEPHLAVTDSFVWTANGRTGEIYRSERDNGSVCTLRLESQAMEISATERDSFYRAADLSYRGEERVARAVERRRDLPLPETKPIISTILGGNADTLWVRSPSTSGYDVVYPVHTHEIGRAVRIPANVQLHAASARGVVVSRQRDNGEPVLEYYIAHPAAPSN